MSAAEAGPIGAGGEARALLRPIRARLAAAVALQVLSSALVLAPLVGVSELASALLSAPVDEARAWRIVVLSAALLGVGLALRGAADVTTHLADNAFALHVRRRVASRLSHAPLGWFTDHASGEIKQGMQDDVAALHHLIAHSATDLAAAVTTPVVAYAYLLWVDWRLALVLVAPLPLFGWIYRQMMVDSGEKMTAYGEVLTDVNDAVVEFVDGISVVKTFGRAGQAHAAYRQAVERFTDFFLGWARPLIRPETISAAVIGPVTMLTLTLTVGTAFVAADWMDGVQLLPFALLGMGVGVPITALTRGAQSLQMARSAAARLLGLLKIPEIAEPAEPLTPEGTTVELAHVDFAYDDRRPVLADVSLTLEPGSVTAVVGPSGSGKSTLARLLLRFFDPTEGEVRLGGVGLHRVGSRQLHQRIGFVLQDVQLLRASIADNIAIGRPGASREEVVAAARAADIHDRITRLPRGYDSVWGEDAQLSGGEAQRVSIARVLLLDPPVLVLDEPTSAADAESERAIQDALSALVVRDGSPRTVLVIAHRLETITRVDTIAVLVDGRIAERGTHPTLLAADGHYSRLWDAQAQAHAEARADPQGRRRASELA